MVKLGFKIKSKLVGLRAILFPLDHTSSQSGSQVGGVDDVFPIE